MRKSTDLYKMVSDNIPDDFIRHCMSEMQLPEDKILSAIDVVGPSLLMAFTHEGPKIQQMVLKIHDPQMLVETIFGNELTNFALKLEHHSGLNLYSNITLMVLLAPLMASVMRENLSRITLRDETTALADIVPTDISNHFNYGASSTSINHGARFIEANVKEAIAYPKDDLMPRSH